MAEKKFKAEIDFEGHIEPSVRESFEKFHEQLEGIQEKAAETTDTLKEMGCREIKTILGRTLIFYFTFPLLGGPFCRGLPPIRASAFGILKLAGSSDHLIGPLPRRFQKRTIFFE